MYPTWPMVIAALVAGALAGFMVPDRPEPRPTAAVSQDTGSTPTATTPQKSAAAARGEKQVEVRSVPLTRAAASEDASSAPAPTPAVAEARSNCAMPTWPYREAGCFDRTASVAPPDTVVKAKRVDPAATLVTQDPARSEPPAQRQKTVAAPPPAPRAEQRPENPITPVAEAARAEAIRPASAAEPQQPREARRPSRQLSRDIDFNDGIPTRVYLRGPDGRLYLAPEYRPDGQYRYFVR